MAVLPIPHKPRLTIWSPGAVEYIYFIGVIWPICYELDSVRYAVISMSYFAVSKEPLQDICTHVDLISIRSFGTNSSAIRIQWHDNIMKCKKRLFALLALWRGVGWGVCVCVWVCVCVCVWGGGGGGGDPPVTFTNDQWCRALMFPLMSGWTHCWTHSREACELRSLGAHLTSL